MTEFEIKSPELLLPLFTEGFNSSKYNINTFCSLTNIEVCHELFTLSTPAFTTIVNGNKVFIFKEEPVIKLSWEISLGSQCESVSISDDFSLLFVVEQSANVHLLHLFSNRVLWSYKIQQNGNPCTLKKVICSEVAGFMTVYVYADEGYFFQFSAFEVSALYKALEEQCISDFFVNIQAKKIELQNNLCITYVFETFNSAVPIGFICANQASDMSISSFFAIEDMVDGDFISEFEFNADPEKYFHFYNFSAYGNISKVLCTRNGRYIVCLSEKKTLLVFCAFTQEFLTEWGDRDIENFTVQNTVDPDMLSESDYQFGVIRKVNTAYLFEIRRFPSFDLIYKLQIPVFVFLCDNKSNQDRWYFVEKESLTDSECILNIKCLCASSPETRLLSLLNLKKFREAVVYAKMNSLDPEVIYKTKISCMLEGYLKAQNFAISENEADVVCKEIDILLSMIKDVEFIKTCVIPVTNEIKIPKKIISCVKTWLSANITADGVQDLICEVNRNENRIITYKLLPEPIHVSLSLKEFLKKDLLCFMTSELISGCLSTALIIWQRHKDEMLHFLTTAQISEMLNAVSRVPSSHLITFLKDYFLRPVLSVIPEVAVEVIEWIISEINILELFEKELWPDNALQLVSLFSDVIQTMQLETCAVSFSTTTSLASLNKDLNNKDTSVGQFYQFFNYLKYLSKLKKKFNCIIPLSTFEESKLDVIFAVLDLMNVKNLIEVITEFARPYALENYMDLDLCLQLYIQHTLENSHVWSQHEDSCEERLSLVIDCIQNEEKWAKAAYQLVSCASVPWSDYIKYIVQKGLNYSQSIASEFKGLLKQVDLKEILLKYEFREFPLNSIEALYTLINYILKQGQDSALDDAKKVILFCSDSMDSQAYFRILIALLCLNKLDQFYDYFLDIPPRYQIENACRILTVISINLEDEFKIHHQVNMHLWIEAGVYISNFLKITKSEKYDPELSNALQSIQKLQKEFGIWMTLPAVMNREVAFIVIEDKINSNLDKEILLLQGKQKDEGTFCAMLSEIHRLCDILHFEWPNVMAILVTKCLEKGLYDLSIQLCGELMYSYSSQSHKALMHVVYHFCKNFKTTQNISFDTLIDTVQHLRDMAITFCPDDALKDSLPAANISSYLSVLQKTMCSQTLSSTFAVDSYHKWKFTPVYMDKGFQLDTSIIVDFIQKIFVLFQNSGNLKPKPEVDIRVDDLYALNFAPLIKHLNNKGQFLASLHTSFLFFHMQMDILQDESSTQKAAQLVKNNIEETVADLIMRVIDNRKLDFDFAISLLNTFPIEPIQVLEQVQKGCRKDLSCMLALGKIFAEYYNMCGDASKSSEFHQLYRRALFLKLQKTKISYADVSLVSLDDKKIWDIVKEVIHCSNVSLSTVLDCCDAFNLETDQVLLVFLNKLLIESDKYCISDTEVFEDVINTMLNQAKCVIEAITCKELVLENLQSILKKIGSYSYEVLTFLYQQILNVSADVSTVRFGNLEMGLQILDFLRVYDRTAPVSEVEKQFWISKHSVHSKVPPISTKRLPFWLILNKYVYKIINPELSAENFAIWLCISPLLNVSEDELVIVAIKNTVTRFLKNSSHYFNLSQDYTLLKNITKMLKCIKEKESAVSTASWIVCNMPPGENKVHCCTIAVRYAKEWITASPTNREACNMNSRLLSLLQLSHIEQILHKYSLVNDTTMSLANYPVQLIEHLVEQACEDVDASIKACKIASEISQVSNVDLKDIFFCFFYKWLTNSSYVSLDESTVNFSAKGLYEEQSSDRNILRTINILLGISASKHNVFKDICDKIQDMESVMRTKLMFCLVSVFGADVCGKATKLSAFGPSDLSLCLSSAQIQSLHLPYSTDMIANCDKVELVQRILSDQYNIKVLLLCVRLCLEYNIWEASIWDIFFHKLVEHSMVDVLENILQTAQGQLVHMWSSKSFISAWNCVIYSYFKNESADPTAVIDGVLKAIYSCKSAASLKLEPLWSDFKYFIKTQTGKELPKINQDLNLFTIIQAMKEARNLVI